MTQTLWIAIGGAIGSIARYWFAVLALPLSRQLPVGTIAINVLGSLAIGFFGTLTVENGRYPLPEIVRLFFMVGFCGGFTTFSSFSLQTLDLLRDGAVVRAMANVGLSVILCLGSVALGHAAASYLGGGVKQVAETQAEEAAS